MKYKLALFDFDGTLADTLPFFIGILDQLSSEFHLQYVKADEIENLRELDAHQLIQKYQVPFWKLALMSRRARKLMTRETSRLNLFDGIEQSLHTLVSEGITLGVVSSNSGQNVRKVLGPQLADLFQYYECGISLFGKSPRIRRILKQSEIRPEETIMIGDEVRDIEAARNVGVACGAVTWGFGAVNSLSQCGPDFLFSAVEDLVDTLKQVI